MSVTIECRRDLRLGTGSKRTAIGEGQGQGQLVQGLVRARGMGAGQAAAHGQLERGQ